MFDGEKTNLFWVGLIILGFASVFTFGMLWQIVVSYLSYLSYSSPYNTYFYGWSNIPIIVGGVVFILIGLYMMKSGVKKNQASQPKIQLLPNAS